MAKAKRPTKAKTTAMESDVTEAPSVPVSVEVPETAVDRRSPEGWKSRAAVCIASGMTYLATAEAVSRSERYVRGLMKNPRFKAHVDRLRAEAVSTAMNRLSSSMTSAADAMRTLVTHPDPHVSFKAAKSIIELALRVSEAFELEARVKDLESKLASIPAGVLVHRR